MRCARPHQLVGIAVSTMALLVGCAAQPQPTLSSGPATTTSVATPAGALSKVSQLAVLCAAMTETKVYLARKPDGSSLLTTSATEATNAAKYGYGNPELLFTAAVQPREGLSPVGRYHQHGDFAWASEGQAARLVAQGYEAQGVSFLAPTDASYCTVPAFDLTRQGKHTIALEGADLERLVAQGWTKGAPAFNVRPLPTAMPSTKAPAIALADPDPGKTTFSFAVIPDTQPEVHRPEDARLRGRFEWLVEQRDSLNLRFAAQVGDLVDWPTDDNAQYRKVAESLQVLRTGKIPYFLNIGNHDGQAACAGGSACDLGLTKVLLRDTHLFNEFFPASGWGASVGEFESGKVDNTYTTLGAGGLKWMILNLEMWPRPEVVKWANDLVSNHADYNVIVFTHSLLDANGDIYRKSDYGSTSPAQLYSDLLLKHPNVKLAFCGHTGTFLTRTDQGASGNKVVTMLTAFHSKSENPTRIVQVDTKDETVRTWVESPNTGTITPGSEQVLKLPLAR